MNKELKFEISQSILDALEILRQKGDVLMKDCQTDADMIIAAVLSYLVHAGVTPFLKGSSYPKIPEECTAEELAQMMELGWDLFIADGKMLGWIKREKN